MRESRTCGRRGALRAWRVERRAEQSWGLASSIAVQMSTIFPAGTGLLVPAIMARPHEFVIAHSNFLGRIGAGGHSTRRYFSSLVPGARDDARNPGVKWCRIRTGLCPPLPVQSSAVPFTAGHGPAGNRSATVRCEPRGRAWGSGHIDQRKRADRCG
jgi:hypothetical protein